MSKRRTHSPEFKARVAMEAISGRKTIQEIAADHAIHPIQVSQWKRQLLDGASELFTRGKKNKDTGDSQVKEAELFQQIGKLQMELEWLKKNLSCSDARELRKLVDHDHPELSISRQCALLGLPRSTLYYRPISVRESTLRILGRIDAPRRKSERSRHLAPLMATKAVVMPWLGYEQQTPTHPAEAPARLPAAVDRVGDGRCGNSPNSMDAGERNRGEASATGRQSERVTID